MADILVCSQAIKVPPKVETNDVKPIINSPLTAPSLPGNTSSTPLNLLAAVSSATKSVCPPGLPAHLLSLPPLPVHPPAAMPTGTSPVVAMCHSPPPAGLGHERPSNSGGQQRRRVSDKCNLPASTGNITDGTDSNLIIYIHSYVQKFNGTAGFTKAPTSDLLLLTPV